MRPRDRGDMPLICFIILRACTYCFSRRFTSATLVPLPRAIRICWSWFRKSSSVNALRRIREARCSASSISIADCAFSTRETMSPMPRIREARRSGGKGEGGTRGGVTVHLRKDDARDPEPIVERPGDVHGVLARHRIGDEEDL